MLKSLTQRFLKLGALETTVGLGVHEPHEIICRLVLYVHFSGEKVQEIRKIVQLLEGSEPLQGRGKKTLPLGSMLLQLNGGD